MDDLTPTPADTEQSDNTNVTTADQEVGSGVPSVTLSDGRTAVVRKGKGRDLLEASRRAGTDASRIQFELLCVLTTLEGQPMQFEDFLDMPLDDVTSLMVRFGGSTGDFFPSSAATSSISPR